MNEEYKTMVWKFLRYSWVEQKTTEEVREEAKNLIMVVPWYQWNKRDGVEGMFYDAVYAIAFGYENTFAKKWGMHIQQENYPWYDVAAWASKEKLEDYL